jgi:hypothetical protein
MAARFGSTDADEFTLQQQNVKTKAATKYAVKVLSDIVVLNGILQDFTRMSESASGDYYSKSSLVAIFFSKNLSKIGP